MMNTGLNYKQLVQQIEILELSTVIRFDFGYFTPMGYHSYRGFYEDVALGYTDNEYDKLHAGEFLESLKDMLGKQIHGYKGGEYIIKENTNIWVSRDSSEATGTIITSIKDLGYGYAIINTGYED